MKSHLFWCGSLFDVPWGFPVGWGKVEGLIGLNHLSASSISCDDTCVTVTTLSICKLFKCLDERPCLNEDAFSVIIIYSMRRCVSAQLISC